jgi:hypothetical protein
MKKAAATPGLANIIRGELPENALIQFPSGRWGFVGKVDARLSYVRLDGAPLTAEDTKTVREFGPSLAKVKTLAWPTAEAAIAAAEAIGAKVSR